MTLEEAIKRYKKHSECIQQTIITKEEAMSVYEMLRELKAYKDFEDKGYVMCRFEVVQDDRRRTTKMVLDFGTRELFDNIGEVNADEDKESDSE